MALNIILLRNIQGNCIIEMVSCTLNHGFDDNDRLLPIEVRRRKQGQYTDLSQARIFYSPFCDLHFATCIVSGFIGGLVNKYDDILDAALCIMSSKDMVT